MHHSSAKMGNRFPLRMHFQLVHASFLTIRKVSGFMQFLSVSSLRASLSHFIQFESNPLFSLLATSESLVTKRSFLSRIT
jgi:hypothetical protein